MVLSTYAGGVRPVSPVEDNLLVRRTRLAEHWVIVAVVQISPDAGQAGGNVVVLVCGDGVTVKILLDPEYLFITLRTADATLRW